MYTPLGDEAYTCGSIIIANINHKEMNTHMHMIPREREREREGEGGDVAWW